MRAFKYINDPNAFEVLGDETRRRIIYFLRAKDQTVSQLADALNKTHQAIYHQIKILYDAGLVEVAKEERVGHVIETYYRATAEVFEFRHGEMTGRDWAKGANEVVEALGKVGIEVKMNDESLERMAELESHLHSTGLKPALEEKISELPDIGFFVKQTAYKYAQLATMSGKEFTAMQAHEKALRDLIVSSLADKQKPKT